jgi:hypothetical protein
MDRKHETTMGDDDDGAALKQVSMELPLDILRYYYISSAMSGSHLFSYQEPTSILTPRKKRRFASRNSNNINY